MGPSSDITKTPCATCTSLCCCRVPVTVVDVARIARSLGLPLAEFLWTYVNEDPINEPYVFQVQGLPCSLALKGPEEQPQRCPFVMRIGTRDRCGIYSCRPSICRVFPFQRQRGQLLVNPRASCAFTERYPLRQDDAGLHQVFDACDAELRLHAEFCREWNTTPPRYPSSLSVLLGFVQELIDSGRV